MMVEKLQKSGVFSGLSVEPTRRYRSRYLHSCTKNIPMSIAADIVFSSCALAIYRELFFLEGILGAAEHEAKETQLVEQYRACVVVSDINPLVVIHCENSVVA